ncbi:MAG: hypothetical protein ABEN55_13445 [Bradymonadaceae bacterium]
MPTDIDESEIGEVPDSILNMYVAQWLGWTSTHDAEPIDDEMSRIKVTWASPDGKGCESPPDYISGTDPIGCAWRLHAALPGLISTDSDSVTLHRGEEPTIVRSENPGDRTGGKPGNRGMAEIAAKLAVKGVEPRGGDDE